MVQAILKTNALTYMSKKHIPYFITVLIFLSALFVRLPPIPIGATTLALGEPLFAIAFLLMVLDRWDLNRMFNTPISAIYFIFLAFGIVNLLWSIRFFHNKAGFALGTFRYVFLYPLSLFIGYNYFVTLKHLQNFLRIIQVVAIFFVPLAAVYYVFHIGERGSYLQYFDHTEAWVCSYLVFFSLSMFFRKEKTSWFTKIMTAVGVIIIIVCNRRGIWVSTLASIFIVYYVSVKRISFAYLSKIFIRFMVIAGLLFAITTIAPDNAIVKSVEDRVLLTVQNLEDPTEFGANSIAWRLVIYTAAAKDFVQRPWFGRGIGYQPDVVFPKGEDNYNLHENQAFHDIIMTLLVTTGIFGFVLYSIFHGKFILTMLARKETFDSERRPYIAAMFGMYTTGLIWAIVANDLYTDPNIIITWYLIMGALTRQYVLAKINSNN